ncbi:hypothetical protein DV735_g1610, partial [Chaetothyriales sp. CBS 134920]
MSTVVATAPGALGHHLDHNPSPRSYPPLAPSTAAPPLERGSDDGPVRPSERTPPGGGRGSPRPSQVSKPEDEAALTLDRLRSGGHPKIVVKKEPPASPSLQTGTRHRPRRLDLNTSTASMAGPNSVSSRPSATPLTARDALGTMQDVGLACLSPGFQTQDPTMREQLQRSLSVRDQQRSIIESRLLKSAKGDGPDSIKPADSPGSHKASGGSKKRPPPGLSIVPPAAERFAKERVVQSAPLNHSFPGRNEAHQPGRNVSGQSQLATGSVSHQPAIQTSNRLPPISDVFAPNELRPEPTRPPFLHSTSSSSQHGPPMPSPGFPPQTAHPMSQSAYGFPDRPREYRSAEEAVHDMTGGREELMPKIVHYGSNHQPPTPPSPRSSQQDKVTPQKILLNPMAGRRRSRNEYEDGSTPPLGSGRTRRPYFPFGDERDSPATNRAKKERFLALCAEAWDLFHS